MATVPYASFDPLFWLHHCMVDRVLWLFQNNGGQWGGASECVLFWGLTMGLLQLSCYELACCQGLAAVRPSLLSHPLHHSQLSLTHVACCCPALHHQRTTFTGSYSPFQSLGGDVAQVATLGYVYSTGRTPLSAGGGERQQPREREQRRRSPARRGMDAALEQTAGGVVNSLAATAAVQAAIEQWTGNYTGYAWSVRLQEFDQHQMHKAVHVYVYLNRASQPTIEAMPAKITMVEDFNELRLKPNYCGSVAGFNEHIHESDANHIISRAVDLTECLQKAGLETNVPPASADDPTRGPSKAPIRLSEIRLVAMTADGEDVSDRYNFGKPVVSWSLPVTRTAGTVRAVVSSDGSPIEAEALSYHTAFPASQEVHSLAQGIIDDAVSA
jgi:hypothetical protein